MPDTVAPPDTTSRVAVNGYRDRRTVVGSWLYRDRKWNRVSGLQQHDELRSAIRGQQHVHGGHRHRHSRLQRIRDARLDVEPTGGNEPAYWAIPETGGITVTSSASRLRTRCASNCRASIPRTPPPAGVRPRCRESIAWTDFKTNCWTGGKPQTPLAAGTMIQQAAITVPGLTFDLPFKVCLVDIQIQ